MRLKNDPVDETIPALDLKLGQIAVLMKPSHYSGCIVTRWEQDLVILGKKDGFVNYFNQNRTVIRCRVLEPGELLEIT